MAKPWDYRVNMKSIHPLKVKNQKDAQLLAIWDGINVDVIAYSEALQKGEWIRSAKAPTEQQAIGYAQAFLFALANDNKEIKVLTQKPKFRMEGKTKCQAFAA